MFIIDKIVAIWQSITFGTKFVLISSIFCCIFDILTNDSLFNVFVDIPNKTIYQLELWRLLIPQFFHGDVFNLTISLLGFLFCAIEVEKSYDNIKLIQIIQLDLIKNIVYNIRYDIQRLVLLHKLLQLLSNKFKYINLLSYKCVLILIILIFINLITKINKLNFYYYVNTIPFFCDVFFKNLIIQIIYVLLCFSLSELTLEVLDTQSFGFWNITFIYMMNKGLADQDDYQKFLCLPFSLPSKYSLKIMIISYYPPTFFLIMNLIEFPRLDLIAATLFAFIEYQLFDGFMMKLSKGFVTRIEQSFPFKYIQSRQDFITCDQVNHSFIMDDAKQAEYQLEIGTISTTESRVQDQQQI